MSGIHFHPPQNAAYRAVPVLQYQFCTPLLISQPFCSTSMNFMPNSTVSWSSCVESWDVRKMGLLDSSVSGTWRLCCVVLSCLGRRGFSAEPVLP